ncbi:MAG: TlpA disulfide reductase family protein [Rhodospirillales bacterium]|jgi:thiol-disulfide isomerase/thioredoxin|nr:TlpA disulfide reductase family protein [Rhodospirillales bacterium]|tara:strand:+ start:1426 stop:2025 length:600 start_codon:yes stop_codon:yes gene_type:complete
MRISAGLRPLIFTGLVALAAIQAPAPAGAAGPELSGHMQNFVLAPEARGRGNLKWKNGNGGEVNLADFKGKVVLLNFWATWCAPCIRELPSLDRLQASMGGKDFTVIALNIDRGGKRVAKRMLRRLKLKRLDLNLDRETKVAKALGVLIMPTTFLFDRQGTEIGKMEGVAEWDQRDASRLIKYFIDNPGHAGTLPPYKK